MFGKYLEQVRKRRPLIHNITNYVTVNDVANTILACGASPVMSDEPEDVEDITSVSDGLNINIGTLTRRTIRSMYLAGLKSVELEHMVLLDPVGAGASKLRTETAFGLMNELHPDVIKGNVSEINTLAAGTNRTRGVDVNSDEVVTEENLVRMSKRYLEFAGKTRCIIVATGAIDVVCDERKCYAIRNGRPEMMDVTGTGCMLAGMMTAFLAANPLHKTEAVVAAVCCMGLAGEIAWDRMQPGEGNTTYRNRLIDAIYNMDGEMLDGGCKVQLLEVSKNEL